MIRRNNSSILANPVLVGAITVLVTVVGVFLAYNANNGLPFVPVYNLHAELPNASGLIRGNDVLIGGDRVGRVASITAHLAPNGALTARATLELEKSVEPLPADSTVLVRPKSPLGLKYVQLTVGHSRRTLPPDATIALAPHARRPVEIDDFFDTWDTPTRLGSRSQIDEFGTGVAGRGPALNQTFAALPHTVRVLEPVMRNLMDPRTRWGALFPSLERAAREVAPVASTQGHLFAALDTTFTAWASVAPQLQASIAGGPPALDTATRELPRQAPFVNASTRFFHAYRPAFTALATASTQLAPAFRAGVRSLPRAAALNKRVTHTLGSIEQFASDPRTIPGLDRLAETANLLNPLVAFATPAQTTCNYYALFFRNLESALSESDSIGSFLRVGILALPQLPNSEAGPASAPANGPPPAPGLSTTQRSLVDDSFLHSNPYPNTAAPGQTHECEAGNETGKTYLPEHQQIGNLPGNQTTINEPTKRALP